MFELITGILSWALLIVLAEVHKVRKIDRMRREERQATYQRMLKAERRKEDETSFKKIRGRY